MRHGKKFNHLGRTTSHRSAMLSNMACSLIEHKRINTTVAKAKALRVYIEPILTKSKDDSTHNRRTVFSYLQSKESVTELFKTVAPKIADRPGGYTRIIKTGFRLGDAADMAMIELVDFNDIYNPNEAEKKTTRRSRKASTAKKVEKVATIADAKISTKTEAPVAELEEVKAPETDTTKEETAE
jgi:large subunit ribosomal protein L17